MYMKIAICDEDAAVRDEVVRIIKATGDANDIFEYGSGEELLNACAAIKPDVILLGIEMDNADAMLLVRPLGYLMKPIEEAAFKKQYEEIRSQYKRDTRNMNRTLLIRSNYELRKVEAMNILYAESDRRKNILHLKDETITYYGSISRLEKELPDSFFRIHKGYLVNMRYIKKYDRTQVSIKNGDVLLISKYRYNEFERAYKRFMRA